MEPLPIAVALTPRNHDDNVKRLIEVREDIIEQSVGNLEVTHALSAVQKSTVHGGGESSLNLEL
jgi:hypothetical protein